VKISHIKQIDRDDNLVDFFQKNVANGLVLVSNNGDSVYGILIVAGVARVFVWK